MADTTTPVTGTTPTPQDATQVNDLQINLADVNEQSEVIPQGGTSKTEIQPSTGNLKPSTQTSDLDLSLDLNLPDAPKDDDRLKTEDQKNKEVTLEPINKTETTENLSDRRGNEGEVVATAEIAESTPQQKAEAPVETAPAVEEVVTEPVVEETPAEVTPEVAPEIIPENEPIVEKTVETAPAVEEVVTEPVVEETTAEVTPEVAPESETKVEQTVEEVKTEPVAEETPAEINPELAPGNLLPETEIIPEPSSKIEELPASSEILGNDPLKTSETIGGNTQTSSNLQEDMKMIEEMEGHTSAGGLATEAMITPQPTPTETPKTFDLDAMLGTTPVNKTEDLSDRRGNEGEVVSTAKIPEITTEQKAVEPIPQPATFNLPTESSVVQPATNTQVPVQAIMQTSIPQNKTTGVKVLLFVVLFVALGFTTFFILKTMYPIEFASIFNGGESQMHAVSEEVTGTMEGITGNEMIDEIVETTGEVVAEENIGDEAFGELNDLTTTVEAEAETDVSRLTKYLTQGNDFVTQGNSMNNNTVIKYGLYISKKSTAFLEKIANGEEINNLSGYFAQFDQYISQLENILSQTTDTVSPTLPTNESETITGTTPTETNTGITSE